jgi:two-component sensor histidine kinase
LLAELDHQLKNTLSSIHAIAKRTAHHANSIEDFLAAFEAQLGALSKPSGLNSMRASPLNSLPSGSP